MRWVAALSLLAFHAAYAETLAGTVVSVIDGDTLVVQDAAKKRHVVRLADIDAPERKQPFFLESARSLASLCHRKSAQVEWSDRDSRKRPIGYVTCAGKDANAEQLRRGMAWASPKATRPTSAMYELETYARLRRIGLWQDERAVPPWEFGVKK
jgi:endonuclease YncB( thermonuclease family)